MRRRTPRVMILDSDDTETEPAREHKRASSAQQSDSEFQSDTEAFEHDKLSRQESQDEDQSESDAGYDRYKPDELSVVVPVPERPWEYEICEEDSTVEDILNQHERSDGEAWYTIRFQDGREKEVPFNELIQLRNGKNALDAFGVGDNGDTDSDSISWMPGRNRSSPSGRMAPSAGKRTRGIRNKNNYVGESAYSSGSDDELLNPESTNKRRRIDASRWLHKPNDSRLRSSHRSRNSSSSLIEDSDSDIPVRNVYRRSAPRGRTRSTTGTMNTRSRNKPSIVRLNDEDELVDELSWNDEDQLADELSWGNPLHRDNGVFHSRSKTRQRRNGNSISTSQSYRTLTRRQRLASSSSPEPSNKPTRRSTRERRNMKNMREVGIDEEIYANDISGSAGSKVRSVREIFPAFPKDSAFLRFHEDTCDVCDGRGTRSNKGISQLIPCQGCSTSIHKICLGSRSGRDHIVTKVGTAHFVLQCRRCIGTAAKKDVLAPQLDACQVCKEKGKACAPFSTKKTSKQEEKLRNENNGEDPITEIPKDLIDNAFQVLFRCKSCQRAYHFEHLPGRSEDSVTFEDGENIREERLSEYNDNWQCNDCCNMSSKVQGLVAWRPSNLDTYVAGTPVDELREDDKEYLVKWEGTSYFKCSWMPGAWIWGTTAAVMRKAFVRRDEGKNLLPIMEKEDAIPEEYLRIEIVFDVTYRNDGRFKFDIMDETLIDEVSTVLVKFEGLGYDEAVWDVPPSRTEKDRWAAFTSAYREYIYGKTFRQRPQSSMKADLKVFRSLDFEENIEVKSQPPALQGGKLMKYQIDGLNWLLYNFHQKKNVILADEMGLGKTVQVISMLVSIIQDAPKCWPFLIVTPNSTCPNWRREIKKWAPSIRVVSFYGSKRARDMAMKYELYPDGCTDMRAHVVITSYETPVDPYERQFFRRIKWTGLIVDEGQRLKNDTNLLYGALEDLRIPFRVLLTGTPLQNNKRELFNLLQFLETSMNAAALDKKYAELTKENLPELHDLIRPYFLRRTKLQVLKFLPPMAQVIVPVTMTILQKKLYKSILAKNPDLIKSVFGQGKSSLRASERGNLNNILMQLRKCLCHPFIYSSAIEETSVSPEAQHRNLIDASSKFQLLEIMLPKLRSQGHRVLLFSQFLEQLDLVEDFLNGLGLPFQRLDGSIGALEKQRRIDAFNSPDSPLFAFLLSTRAGGVGINLATADTVIIMDPDFNPHQDIQALSRAHRIGQKKKVLVFQLMTKGSAEEKMVQIGRKKMALDQALIESLDADEDAGVDLESILRHGAEALFNDDDRNDIHYDSASIDKLLDRTLIEKDLAGDEKVGDSRFSYARVWSSNRNALVEELDDRGDGSTSRNATLWEKILKQREADATREAAKNAQTFGRGRRARQAIDYGKDALFEDGPEDPPIGRRRSRKGSADPEFAAEPESEEDSEIELEDTTELNDLKSPEKLGRTKSSSRLSSTVQQVTDPAEQKSRYLPPYSQSLRQSNHQSSNLSDSTIRRADNISQSDHYTDHSKTSVEPSMSEHPRDLQLALQSLSSCVLCKQQHPWNYCPLLFAKARRCQLCKFKHAGLTDDCRKGGGSEARIRYMLDILGAAEAPKEQIDNAELHLRNELHYIARRKLKRRQREGLMS